MNKFDRYGLPIISPEEELELIRNCIGEKTSYISDEEYTSPLCHVWTKKDDEKFPNATDYFKIMYHPDMDTVFFEEIEKFKD